MDFILEILDLSTYSVIFLLDFVGFFWIIINSADIFGFILNRLIFFCLSHEKFQFLRYIRGIYVLAWKN